MVTRYLAAIDAGDRDGAVQTFSPEGYVREPIGARRAPSRHRRSSPRYFSECFGVDGGIGTRPLLRDRRRRAVHARVQLRALGQSCRAARKRVSRCSNATADGLLAAVRYYDDIEPPVGR